VWRAQIKKTVEEHLKKEVKIRDRGLKVLSLFFIDKVANYRDYDDDGNPTQGKFAQVIEEELATSAKEEEADGAKNQSLNQEIPAALGSVFHKLSLRLRSWTWAT
jgi:restriction endonuclease